MIKSVPDYDGYFVDTEGNVYSQWINKGYHGLVKGNVLKKLKCSTNHHGYKTTRFGRNCKQIYVHRLIYKVFNGEIPNGLVVRHKNDIPDDNRLENLILGTQLENMRDAQNNGIFPLGSRNGVSKLTEDDIPVIRSLQGKMTHAAIAEKYHVTRKTISHVLNGSTWRHVQ